MTLLIATLLCAASITGHAQSTPDTPSTSQPIATMPITDAKVTGAVQLRAQQVELSSGASIAAAGTPVPIGLERGGSVLLCQNSAAHLSRGANAGEIMLALDRGAVELHSPLGQASDVVLTPDLRLIVSGPAKANVSIRINPQGDTCIDNAGSDAPYLLVTEQLGTGVYRVRAGQHLMFEGGSVSAVIDSEKEPCGCPAATAPAAIASSGTTTGKPEFPLAESEGLITPPASTVPAVPAGEVHAQVTIPFSYNGNAPAAPVPPDATAPTLSTASAPSSGPANGSESASAQPNGAVANTTPATQPSASNVPAASPGAVGQADAATSQQATPDAWSAIKHFFHKLFRRQ